jgi:hypothetical protein
MEAVILNAKDQIETVIHLVELCGALCSPRLHEFWLIVLGEVQVFGFNGDHPCTMAFALFSSIVS